MVRRFLSDIERVGPAGLCQPSGTMGGRQAAGSVEPVGSGRLKVTKVATSRTRVPVPYPVPYPSGNMGFSGRKAQGSYADPEADRGSYLENV